MNIRIAWFCLLAAVAWIIIASCQKMLPPAPAPEEIAAEPIPGLPPDQQKVHLAGDEAFAHIYTPQEGLGPVFVQSSCEGCHIGDGKGHPVNQVIRFGKLTGGGFDYLLQAGGPQLQYRAVSGFPEETLPADATHSTVRLAPLVTGLGYLAAVHDSTLLALADPADLNGDGISGRPHYLFPRIFFVPGAIHMDSAGYYIGRFGKKAAEITLLDQVVFALREDIGISSYYDPVDIYNPQTGNLASDDVPDPEVSASTVHNLVFYLRTLKTPPRRDQSNPDVIAGDALFRQTGCAKCHVPELKTAKSDIAALSEKVFYPYTDLLLHDMGPLLNDGYPEGNASSSEWRTPPLWGIGLAAQSQGGKAYYLHDGRASSLEQAIALHGGEAEQVITKFYSLTENERAQIIRFLESL